MSTSSATTSAVRLQYEPAIDGLRCVAVCLVLLFHGGWSLFSGGYVGVSLFFTLSGFLITSLLVVEYETNNKISLRAFYSRRMKRLLPASLFCLILVSIWAWQNQFSGSVDVRSDVIASALQVANWRDLAQGQSYGELIGAAQPGPLDHFWSLSIEEQFYWLWPVVMLWVVRRGKTHQSRSRSVYFLTGLAMIAAPVIAWVWGDNAAYWSTPARFGEILVGASLAMWVRHPQAQRTRWSLWGWLGLLVVLISAVTWSSNSGPAYHGLLPLFAVASAGTILGAMSLGSFRNILSARPFVEIGRRSYGIYLFHWPVFVLITDRTFDISRYALFAIRCVITFAIAGLSFTFFEQPIRRRVMSHQRTFAYATAVTIGLTVGALAFIPRDQALFASAVQTGSVSLAENEKPESDSPGTDVTESPLRVVILGDSTAVALSSGLVSWATDDLTRARIAVVARNACGFARATSIEDNTGGFRSDCDEALGPNLDTALELHPEVAVLMVGLADSGPLTWEKQEGSLKPSDPSFIAHLEEDYYSLLEQLRDAGVNRVVWVLVPAPTSWWLGNLGHAPDSLRTDITNELILHTAKEFPDFVEVIRLDEWLGAREEGENREWRPDGLHLSQESAKRVMDEFLGRILVQN